MVVVADKPQGQFWPRKITDAPAAAPAPAATLPPYFKYNSDIYLPSRLQVHTEIAIPTNRLYGVHVWATANDQAASVEVRFAGEFTDDGYGRQQYYALANAGNSFQDNYQAWVYRDFQNTNTLRVLLYNPGNSDINITLDIEAEPF